MASAVPTALIQNSGSAFAWASAAFGAVTAYEAAISASNATNPAYKGYGVAAAVTAALGTSAANATAAYVSLEAIGAVCDNMALAISGKGKLGTAPVGAKGVLGAAVYP